MKIIGCDLHARQQTIAMLDTDTGEFVEKTLEHDGEELRKFYSGLSRPVLVGIEATGSMQWFLELMEELGIECRVGQLFNPNDMENVKKIQAGYKTQTLSEFTHQPPPAALPAPDFPIFTDDAFKLQFPAYLNFLLQFCPTPPEETALRARFATVGIEAGKPFDLAKLSDVQKGELGLAVKEGYEAIKKQKDSIGKNINGWNVGAAFGNRAFYNGNYLLRAGSALAGIYGNDAVEAMYPQAKAASDGQPLDGSKHNYTLTFAAGQYPPVNAFWSVTMYDGKTQLLIQNPINRYLINSPMLPILRKNADGSLTLYIQKDVPAGDKKANWLPAPDGPIYMVMRLYWPKTEPPSILPPGAGAWQPPAIQVAQ
jgi:hypothetical protein